MVNDFLIKRATLDDARANRTADNGNKHTG
ncbi:hypothetical protein EIO60_03340|nr:hypothetical protein [Candidatus Pantoea persica]